VHLSSDALRGPHGHPFLRMTNAMESALAHGKRVVLDSTGMSYRFRALLAHVRDAAFHVHLTVDAVEWRAREARRTDRAPLDASVYRRSARTLFAAPPDLVIDTTSRSPDEVAALAAHGWEAGA
jgi:chloramphenicol 3-O-phosphotransferase